MANVYTPDRSNYIVIPEDKLQEHLNQGYKTYEMLKPVFEAENAQRNQENMNNPQFIEELFEILRMQRNMRFAEYDTKISQLERQKRLGFDVDAQISEWDAYAQALCNLPEQQGAPWDGGGELTPWPVMPAIVKSSISN